MALYKTIRSLALGFEKENIDTSRDYNQFLLSTYAGLAQEEIEDLSNATMWGYEKRFLKGNPLFNRILGYEVVGKGEEAKLIIIEKEAKIIRQIFDMYLQGQTMSVIGRVLKEQGVKTIRGTVHWGANTVKGVLTNVTYTGNKLTRETTRDLFTNKKKLGQRDKIFIANSHEPIISDETFNEVKRKIEVNTKKRKPRVLKERHPLAERMRCGRCGYFFTKQGRREYALYCGPNKRGTCDSKWYKDEVIREMMIRAMSVKYNLKDKDIVLKLIRELQVINNNDHFEFHRLKFLTEIEILKKQYELLGETHLFDRIELMEKEYLAFEDKITKIEDDRDMRIDALEWLENHKTSEDFINQVTIKIMRAWIIEITVYTENDFIVKWVDGTQTELGSCAVFILKYQELQGKRIKKETGYNLGKSELSDEAICSNRVQREEDEKKEKNIKDKTNNYNEMKEQLKLEGESDLVISKNENVIRIEPGQKDYVIKNLRNDVNIKRIQHNISNHTRDIDRPKLRTAAYCRVSTDSEEQMVSLKTQVAYYTYLILKDPQYEYGGIYADEGVSGKSLNNRTEFLKLLDECRKGNIDLIITKSISRFSRNVVDCLQQIRMLKSLPNPVYVYFEKENLHTKDEKSDLMLSILGGIAQEETLNIGENTAWGRRRLAERGIVRPGNMPYGYKMLKNGEWFVVEEEAEVIKYIYKSVVDGRGYAEVTKELSLKGISSPGGKNKWTNGTVKGILGNEVYRGNYLYQKSYVKDTLQTKVVKNCGELPQYLIEGNHEAIVSSEIWDEAQVILSERSKDYKNRARMEYPKDCDRDKNEVLDKIYTCGECGSVVGHRRYIKGAREMHQWVCNYVAGAFPTRSCDAIRIQQKYIEYHFMKMLQDIKYDSNFEYEVIRAIQTLGLTTKELLEKDNIKAEINRLNIELYKVVDQEINRKGQDSAKVDKLTEQIVELQSKIKEFDDRTAKAESIKEEFKWFIKQLNTIKEDQINDHKGFQYGEKIYFRADIFERVIQSGKIYKDGKIVYQLQFGIEWCSDYRYKDYQDEVKEYETQLRIAKREKEQRTFLNGKEVKELLEFCKEPKSSTEMHAFMNERKKISLSHFRNSVVIPLIEAGKLQYTKPERTQSYGQKYFSKLK